jgi:hypothetical protein
MTLRFDPDQYDYGPASPAIRQILRDWAAIDWFVPTSADDDELCQLYSEHHLLGGIHAPELFSRDVSVFVEDGDLRYFASLCDVVRKPERSWDWKYGVLKKLSGAHAKARGWTLESEASRVRPLTDEPGALFFRLDDGTGTPSLIWAVGRMFPSPIDRLADAAHRASAAFWFEYAQHDLLHAIEWELAEPTPPNGNPFLPLLACARAGGYPFALGPDEVVMFRFKAGS